MVEILKMENEKLDALKVELAHYFYYMIERDVDPDLPMDEYLPEANQLVNKIIEDSSYRKEGELADLVKSIFSQAFEHSYDANSFLKDESNLREIIKKYM